MKKQDKIITVLLVMCITALISQIRAVVLQENEYMKTVEAMNKTVLKNEQIKNRINEKRSKIILSIPGTGINYPIMQSPQSNPDYYLNHDALNRVNYCGTPYLCSDCDIDKSDNLIIYAHNVSGKMFGLLLDYRNVDYYYEHSQIELIVNNRKRIYKILGVMDINLERFHYWEMINAQSRELYDEYIFNVRKNSIYPCFISTRDKTQLLTLSTCDNRDKNGRFVVVAKLQNTTGSDKT